MVRSEVGNCGETLSYLILPKSEAQILRLFAQNSGFLRLRKAAPKGCSKGCAEEEKARVAPDPQFEAAESNG